ncbi:dipeptide transport system permease protein DppC [Brevibacillus agri]|uniref:ABC transporter permease n=1 Tax=Brevibacillus agri TaxID=51101 RepID=A0A3M8A9Z3_9BACL|nr:MULTISPECIES: ABC transporter permease [Brevibacillus]ELK42535.1 oligopeptide ABC transporter permease [Brevibacillus agri BAB-2500]EJL42936.1 ABC-type dipeptide/oligopeptide/nickel transport system, permease component [Brevibacillus sp. CF112]MBG9564543.1 diguanylate cyclase [Brevibacillus agri]MBY0051738.1 ABC transporter permease [Brevibacillus agri]MCG5252134.1 ABC transporter permease [Brevibacillus agri]
MAAEQAANELFRPRAQKTDGQAVQMRPSLTHFQQVTRKLVRNKLAMVGFTLIVLMVVMAIVGPHLVPYSYSDQSLLTANQEISAEHWFGTDELGRDMFSRTWYGARISLIIGVTAALIDLVIGVTIGGIAGYMAGRGKRGDRIDTIIMRLIEVLYGLPYLLVVIMLMVVMEPGILTIIIALSATGWTGMARLVRGQILQLKNQEFIMAAQVLGAKFPRILLRHLIPNTIGVIIVNLTFTIPSAIFAESFLSFLGLGVQAPIASWGTMTNDALGVILTGDWWRLFFPALMISLTMFAFNVFGDGLQDALDPRIRE